MPYARNIPQKKCSCGKDAKVTLYNDNNSSLGDYCVSCGNRKLKKLIEQYGRYGMR